MRSRERGITKPKATTSMQYHTMVENTRELRDTWKKTAKLEDMDFKNHTRNRSVA